MIYTYFFQYLVCSHDHQYVYEWFPMFWAREVWVYFYSSCPWLVVILDNRSLNVLSPNFLGKGSVRHSLRHTMLGCLGYSKVTRAITASFCTCFSPFRNIQHHSLYYPSRMRSWDEQSLCCPTALWCWLRVIFLTSNF
jgi:hypothetical protein